ncbi:MAG: acylneuraminate cytidylyltransferase family protein [Deltaproteobacteria bacterium]|nr:acylneuraminate cytidylyltransferase family protein [Deltaproteobacteria bacterium]
MSLKILTLIPARSGSKGLRHKNVQQVGGLTLLERTIKLAQESIRHREQWSIVVSTDSPGYAKIACLAGAEVPFLRPPFLANDTARLTKVIAHALMYMQNQKRPFDMVIMLSPTTPLTLPKDVRAAINLYKKHQSAVISVTTDRTAPSWRFTINNGQLLAPARRRIVHRQEEPKSYVLNGAIYIASPQWLKRHKQFYATSARALIMPPERSLDIENKHDLNIAQLLIEQSKKSGRIKKS